MKWLSKNWFKIGIILVVFVLAYSIYYSMVVIPQQKIEYERQKIEYERNEATKIEYQQQLNQGRLDLCLLDADIQYSDNWARACESNAKANTEGYNNCMSSQYSSVSLCRTVWKTPDPSSNCSLPTARADNVNKYKEQDKNDCYRLFPVR